MHFENGRFFLRSIWPQEVKEGQLSAMNQSKVTKMGKYYKTRNKSPFMAINVVFLGIVFLSPTSRKWSIRKDFQKQGY